MRGDEDMAKTQLLKSLHRMLSREPYRRASGFIAAVSGGVDSMVMLDALLHMRSVHGAPVRVVHIHHGTGRFADVSEQTVRDYCARQQIPVDVVPYRHDGQGNFEYQAAIFRREALEARREEGWWILKAHHLDDQTETFFQALVRGSGATSPVGMRPQRDHTLRPLLSIDRSLILEHAALCAVPHVLDPDNFRESGFRTALRARVIPLLRDFHGSFEARLNGWLQDHADLTDTLSNEAEGLFKGGFKDGLLNRRVFRVSKPYLHPFIMKHFWRAINVPHPKREQADVILYHLTEDTLGALEIGASRLYLDDDALTLLPPTPERVTAKPDEEISWGEYTFLYKAVSPRAGALTLEPVGPMGKLVKEALRGARIPQRLRSRLPDWRMGRHRGGFWDLYLKPQTAPIQLIQQAGPPLSPFLDRLTKIGKSTATKLQ